MAGVSLKSEYTLMHGAIALLLMAFAGYAVAEPSVTQDFSFCEPNVIVRENGDPSPTLPFEYRSPQAHDEWPSDEKLISEINESSFDRVTEITIERPGKYLFLFCIRNDTGRAVTVVQQSRWITVNRIYKKVGSGLLSVKETSFIGLVRSLDLDPGLNIFFGIVSQPSHGTFKSGWTTTSSWDDYLKQGDFPRILYAIFAGYIMMTVLFALYLLLIYRKIYLTYYLGYLLTIASLVFMWNGILLESDFMRYGISTGLSGAFALLFLKHLIERRSSAASRVMNVMIGLNFFAAAWSLLQREMGFSGLTFLGSMLLFVVFCIRRSRDNRVIVGVLLSGTGSVALGGLLVILNYYLALNIRFADHAVLWGMMMEISSFSLAMLLKIRFSERKALKENKHAFHEMNKIVYPHQLRMIKGGLNLEQTMPIHESEACVLAFDVISSTSIQHPRSKEFFRNVFARCYAAMSEGYDSRTARARAYRIKEMGDGFLCSIGYPFQGVSDNPANDAVSLAIEFALILSEESALLDWPTPIACGLGIAAGAITGFYPKSGAMEYDLFGSAIVLATRYESMRKSLFPEVRDRCILILHEAVFRALTSELKGLFTEVDLTQERITVRDDPGAERLYYHLLEVRNAGAAAS